MKIQDLFAKKRLLFLSAVLFAFQLNVRADDDAPALQIHGYGTQGYSRILGESENNSLGYGVIDKSGTFLYNSLLGVNLSYKFNDQVTFYGQMTATGSYFASAGETSSYPVSVDMAMLNYHPFDWVDIRIGRQIMPIWMVSEQIDVGVTYPWIRPPMDVYNLAPVKSATGIGVDLKHNLFDVVDVLVGARVGQGTYTDTTSYAGPVDLSRIFVGYAELNFSNALKLRSSYGSTYARAQPLATPELATSGAVSTTTFAPATSTGQSNYNSEFTFYSFGGSLDWDNFLLMGEYAATNQTIDSITPADTGYVAAAPTGGTFKLRSWYATAAYHFGNWTPHFTYSTVEKNLHNANYDGISGSGYTAGGLPVATATGGLVTDAAITAGAIAAIVAKAQPTQSQHTYTIGLNYNFTPTIVGKMQFEQVRTFVGAGGTSTTVSFINSPYLPAGDTVNIGEAAVSFVF